MSPVLWVNIGWQMVQFLLGIKTTAIPRLQADRETSPIVRILHGLVFTILMVKEMYFDFQITRENDEQFWDMGGPTPKPE